MGTPAPSPSTVPLDRHNAPTPRRERLLSRGDGFELVLAQYPPHAAMSAHRHEFSKLSLVLSGSLLEESEGGTHLAGPGCVGFKPAGTEHADRFGREGALIFALRFDPRWKLAAAAIKDYAWRSQDEIAWKLLSFYPNAAAADPSLIARCLVALTRSTSIVKMRTAPPWLMSVQDRLHQCDTPPSEIGKLARELDTHPVYLARMFRRQFGCSPKEYSRRARMTLAAGALVSSQMPAAAIAARFGYADQAHLCRMFRAQLGMTPGAYRRSLRPR